MIVVYQNSAYLTVELEPRGYCSRQYSTSYLLAYYPPAGQPFLEADI